MKTSYSISGSNIIIEIRGYCPPLPTYFGDGEYCTLTQKWQEGEPVSTRIVADDDTDIEALNIQPLVNELVKAQTQAKIMYLCETGRADLIAKVSGVAE